MLSICCYLLCTDALIFFNNNYVECMWFGASTSEQVTTFGDG